MEPEVDEGLWPCAEQRLPKTVRADDGDWDGAARLAGVNWRWSPQITALEDPGRIECWRTSVAHGAATEGLDPLPGTWGGARNKRHEHLADKYRDLGRQCRFEAGVTVACETDKLLDNECSNMFSMYVQGMVGSER
ncbi:hypothetical protein NDU88_001670 [Pleurodeles waltl]|uniref:Uncharacterized protein n=1 Tax=Pleurodeles waltl TaxID=8319 RepID=A0AAV7T0Y5_PLEWA|nr:hypothetical protein NDU88_001670 [Pleurodeles waltl]